MPPEARVEELVSLHFAPQRRIARDVADQRWRRRDRHVVDRRTVAVAQDRVLAIVVAIDHAPDLARARRSRRDLLELNLRKIVDVVAGKRPRDAARAGRRYE